MGSTKSVHINTLKDIGLDVDVYVLHTFQEHPQDVTLCLHIMSDMLNHMVFKGKNDDICISILTWKDEGILELKQVYGF